eukprot:scaffold14179_cov155-Skeletonema_dohrnii-CCMP3373.AAC.4
MVTRIVCFGSEDTRKEERYHGDDVRLLSKSKVASCSVVAGGWHCVSAHCSPPMRAGNFSINSYVQSNKMICLSSRRCCQSFHTESGGRRIDTIR